MESPTPGAIGIDEAGRGPLAGPVVVAAVMIPVGAKLPHLDDSKKLTRKRRETARSWILENCPHSIEIVDAEEIDRLNILRASLVGMERAAQKLLDWQIALIDGHIVPKALQGRGEAIVKGDGKHPEIAAASILAKTTRDAMMVAAAEEYPEYGFEKHFGYPTPVHLKALREHGPCAIHRRSFAPVADALKVRAPSGSVRKRSGMAAELQALGYLRSTGLTIITRNYRGGGGEIDAIALEGDTLVVIETKLRESVEMAITAVDDEKCRRIASALQAFLGETLVLPEEIRFDIVAVSSSTGEVEHLKGAFAP